MSDKLPPKVLIIESFESPETMISVRNTIERYFFDVIKATPAVAIEQSFSEKPNIIIISSKIEGMTLEALAEVFHNKPGFTKIPIIFLLSSGEQLPCNITNSFIEILYQPFSSADLVGCLKSCLRKSQPVLQDKTKKYKDVSIDLSTYKVYRGGKVLHLGPTEFKILSLLLEHPKEILTRESIINYAWDKNPNILYRTVDVHVNRLRDALRDSLENKDAKDYFIKTVRSKGYCLNLPGEVEVEGY